MFHAPIGKMAALTSCAAAWWLLWALPSRALATQHARVPTFGGKLGKKFGGKFAGLIRWGGRNSARLMTYDGHRSNSVGGWHHRFNDSNTRARDRNRPGRRFSAVRLATRDGCRADRLGE